MRAVVVVPTYNESATLPALLAGLAPLLQEPNAGGGVDVLVVDDASPDGTADLVRAHPDSGDRVHLLARAGKQGLGAAYRAGFEAALAGGYDVVVQMDADGSHPWAEVAPMLRLLDDHDLVVGSRYVPGGRTEGWPARRRALSWAANAYARALLRLRTHDATAGFRTWRADALVAAGVLGSAASGYGFQVENTWRAERAGLRVVEHPITFVERTAAARR